MQMIGQWQCKRVVKWTAILQWRLDSSLNPPSSQDRIQYKVYGMSKLLVTGATGELGRLTIQALLKRVDPAQIVALVRDSTKAAPLTAQGVDVRRGDYFDLDSLISAFHDVDKVLLVSAVAFTDRLTQHLNVIKAAKTAGVKHIVYTSIQRRSGSTLEISMVTQSDKETEDALRASGLAYTILRNSLYLEVLPFMLGNDVFEQGVRLTHGDGKGAIVSRSDLAEANAVVLTQPGHENSIYTLGASEAFSFSDVAAELSEISGKSVVFAGVCAEEFAQRLHTAGFPQAAADFLSEWSMAVSAGEFAQVTGDLERLIEREPMNYKTYLRQAYGS
jgi:NAD(P)H dehydrogenase (quinone)